MYGVNKIGATNELAKKTGCSKTALAKIINKGAGAYYSSGSRPNQTAQSWGIARLASAITSGKAAAVDYSILEKGCKPGSKALRLAKMARKKHGHGTRKVPKVNI
jgi:DNA-binding Xre family transcriptional regulator